MNDIPVIKVAAGVIYNDAGQVLLAQRPPKSHLEGWWEFPGGKLEAGETDHMALSRELHEELGIEVFASRPLMSLHHGYPEREVVLQVREVLRYQGEPRGMEGQPLAWVSAGQLHDWPLLPADEPIVRSLLLPHQYMITPDLTKDHADQESLARAVVAGLVRALELGMRLIQLRLPTLDADNLKPLIKAAVREVHGAGGHLLVNEHWQLARECGADGVHLKSAQLLAMKNRPDDLPLVAASTHNAEELARAAQMACDFVCLGPVRRTSSHPQAKPISWRGLGTLIQASNLPVFALGGVRLEDFDQARESGAIGVAGIRGFWPGTPPG